MVFPEAILRLVVMSVNGTPRGTTKAKLYSPTSLKTNEAVSTRSHRNFGSDRQSDYEQGSIAGRPCSLHPCISEWFKGGEETPTALLGLNSVNLGYWHPSVTNDGI
jgi:hypothetical protein